MGDENKNQLDLHDCHQLKYAMENLENFDPMTGLQKEAVHKLIEMLGLKNAKFPKEHFPLESNGKKKVKVVIEIEIPNST